MFIKKRFRNNPIERKKKYVEIVAVILILLICIKNVSAQVITTSEATSSIEGVYVAGNPNLYPIEYYNKETGNYEGIVPEMLERVSEKTGMNFIYINGGKRNLQQTYAENCGVELISAHVSDRTSEWKLQKDQLYITLGTNEEPIHIYIGFTESATKSLVEKVGNALDEVCREEFSKLGVSYIMTENRKQLSFKVILIAMGFSVVLTAGLIIYVIRERKKRRVREKDKMSDSLTGMGNARFLEYQFNDLVSERTVRLYYLAYIGIQNMEKIRQYQGLEEADEFQRYVAAVLAQRTSDDEAAARLRDGIFVLLLQADNDYDMEKRVEELVKELNEYTKQFNKDYKTDIHAGMYHLETRKVKCGIAVYCAKQGYFYAVQHDRVYAFGNKKVLNDVKEEALLKRELLDALKNREFQMYLQFIVDKNTKKICGAEALSRWQNPRKGLLNPGRYIGLLYEADIIEKLDFYILEEACRQLEEWAGQGHDDLRISCNFTRTVISRENFMEVFRRIVEKYRFRHERLWMEITEDSLAENNSLIRRNIVACSKMGFFIVLDDFGSGYSSLMDLCDYPLNCVKIDRSIIQKSIYPRGMELLNGICRLSHEMRMHVLCEGVETEEENSQIEKLSCEYVQGFYYSKVFSKEDAMEYYEKYTTDLNNSQRVEH